MPPTDPFLNRASAPSVSKSPEPVDKKENSVGDSPEEFHDENLAKFRRNENYKTLFEESYNIEETLKKLDKADHIEFAQYLIEYYIIKKVLTNINKNCPITTI